MAAAVCPHPPLLVPELAAGAAPELEPLRHACDLAVASLAGADEVVVLGGDDGRHHRGFAAWGVDVPLGNDRPLPLSLLMGRWLLARHLHVAPEMVAVPGDADAHACAERGARLAADPRRLALLVLGDGSRCRGQAAPGYDDPRAAGYDAQVAGALAEVDTGALLALDPQLSAELGAAGRAPWQTLAGAVRATGGSWQGRLHHDAAPYGVAYLVATWTPA